MGVLGSLSRVSGDSWELQEHIIEFRGIPVNYSGFQGRYTRSDGLFGEFRMGFRVSPMIFSGFWSCYKEFQERYGKFRRVSLVSLVVLERISGVFRDRDR